MGVVYCDTWNNHNGKGRLIWYMLRDFPDSR